jgi:hypothetical protein
MTDDELDRALFALPLEAPPADLRARILGATVDRPRLTFNTWEVWVVGTLVAFMVWLAVMVATSVPHIDGAVTRSLLDAFDLFEGSVSLNTLMWVALGASFVFWISQLTLPQAPRREAADR